ncbi:unnamed protein product [Prorocentrum cordatum]|uniref:methenyltetrahydrofolate cyclohydrolase n=1 Tax=Prorocentrum cordatum TaxID=2364126 RepID=A0ABN9V5V2_9DINO|nr:unnamed protein product [Polarella glacialis]
MSTVEEPPRVAVALQLDYFMSAQFAGVAVALRRGMYEAAQLDVTILPECPPGAEPQRVMAAQAAQPDALCVGSVEQNVLAPWAAAAPPPGGGVVAVGAMFGRSPLCLAALPAAAVPCGSAEAVTGSARGTSAPRVGAHEDTTELLRRLLPHATVVDVPRVSKLGMLRSGELDAVQIYDCMEAITLQRELDHEATGASLRVTSFDALRDGGDDGGGDVALGYAQTLFAPAAVLREGDARRGAMLRFMCATFDGWRLAIADPASAAIDVLALQPVGIDHFESSADFVTEAVRRCCGYVKRTSAGDMLGVIDPATWDRANVWLLGSAAVEQARAPILEPTLWAPDARLMLGSRLAPQLLAQARALATRAAARLGRRPRLCVVTVGPAPLGAGHPDAARRLEALGIPDASWFDKPAAGAAVGIDVEELRVPAEGATTAQLVAVVREACERADGIQIMWPLPAQVSAAAVYAAVPEELDADGCRWLSQMELAGGQSAVLSGQRELLRSAPVTAAAVIRLLDHYEEPIAGRRALVVGRSRLCGAPLAFMLGARGALVTTAHSRADAADLRAACLEAAIVVPCVGRPGLIVRCSFGGPSWSPPADVFDSGSSLV